MPSSRSREETMFHTDKEEPIEEEQGELNQKRLKTDTAIQQEEVTEAEENAEKERIN